ncbi:MAG: hypothetical protein HQL16_05420 [Candidatus Omnitrophica bacterium]|nr:hypothetical protein [Candidatus Omnitrophota bacterium]
MNCCGSKTGRRAVALALLLTFLVSGIVPPRYALAQQNFPLPQPQERLSLSPAFIPPLLKGVKVYPDNPFQLDFILDKGDSSVLPEVIRGESARLIKYFLAALTVPEKDLWVNLSPYEKDRIVPDAFGVTEMGRDLLAQDYILKQITASVIYPESATGKEFWEKVYAEAQKRYGTTDISVDTFNKVWIVPEKALVYENKNAAYVVEGKLKVMLESDYLAQGKNGAGVSPKEDIAKQIIREVVIPILEKEVNEGQNFAKLRQVYQSLILATWYKDKIKASLLGKAYVDQKKTGGVDIEDKAAKDKIWAQYVSAFKKGVFNFVKEERDEATGETVPRKYFSGGAGFNQIRDVYRTTSERTQLPQDIAERAMIVTSRFDPADNAMRSPEFEKAFSLVRHADWEDMGAIHLLEKIGVQSNQALLSVGPGLGMTHLVYASLKGARVDINQPEFYVPPKEGAQSQPHLEMLEDALADIHDEAVKRINVRAYPVPIQEANIPESSYDFVSLLNVLDGVNLRERREIAKHVVAAVKSNGVILLSALSENGFSNSLLELKAAAISLDGTLDKIAENDDVIAFRVRKHIIPARSPENTTDRAQVVFDTNDLSQELIDKKQALREEEVAAFEKELPQFDWGNAAQVPWKEVIRFSSEQPHGPETRNRSFFDYGTFENQKNYWDNNVLVRRHFLFLVREMLQNQKMSLIDFSKRVSEIHFALRRGKGSSLYKSDFGTDEGKKTGVLLPFSPHLNRVFLGFKNLLKQDVDKNNLSRNIALVVDFYRSLFDDDNDYLFEYGQGNNSFYMNMINGMFRLYALQGISHAFLDHKVVFDKVTLGVLLGLFLQSLKEANPENQGLGAIASANNVDAAQAREDEENKDLKRLMKDGLVISSKNEGAGKEFMSLSDSLAGQVQKAVIPNLEEIVRDLNERITRLEEKYLPPQKDKWYQKNVPIFLKASREGLEKLKRLYESGRILKRPMIVQSKNNFAAGYSSEDRMIMAEEFLQKDNVFLAEYLLYLSTDFGEDSPVWRGLHDDLFPENYKKGERGSFRGVNTEIRKNVLEKASVRNGIDYRAMTQEAVNTLSNTQDFKLELTDGSEPYYWAQSGGELEQFLRRDKDTIFYGEWSAILSSSYAVRSKTNVNQSRIKVLLDREHGVVGVWDVSSRLNDIVKKVLSQKGVSSAVVLSAVPLSIVIDFYELGLPFSDEILRNYIEQTVFDPLKTFLPYEQFASILDEFMVRFDRNERMLGTESRYYSVPLFFGLLEPKALAGFLRRYFVEHHVEPRQIRKTLGAVLESTSAAEMLWNIYLNPQNTPQDNALFLKALTIQGNEDIQQAHWKIYNILSQKNLEASSKAIQVLLRLENARENQSLFGGTLFTLPEVAGPFEEVVSSYVLAHLKLFGAKTRAARDGRDSESLDGFSSEISSDTRNSYYYLMQSDALKRQGGAFAPDVDPQIFYYAKALDGDADYPGRNGQTWFTFLRGSIHESVDKKHLYLVEGILEFWNTLDPGISQKVFEKTGINFGLLDAVVDDPKKEKFSEVLKKTVKALLEQGKISTEEGAIEQLLLLDEDAVADAVEQANSDYDPHFVRQVETMLRLYFALRKKFTTNLPWAIDAVKRAEGLTHEEHEELMAGLESGESLQVLEAVVKARLTIRQYFFTHKLPQMTPNVTDEVVEQLHYEEAKRNSLAALDHNLQIIGRYYLNSVFNEKAAKLSNPRDIQANIKALVGMARFLQSGGIGGIDFEEFIDELEYDKLSASQLRDILRGLGLEALKATQRINNNMRFVIAPIFKNDIFHYLTASWRPLLKEEVRTVNLNGEEYEREVVTDQSKLDIENALVDELLRDAGLDIFKMTLTKFDQVLDEALKQGDEKREPVQEKQEVALEEQFLRFGQGVGHRADASPTLLSSWSKKGLNLVRMSEEGFPVPPGVVVSSGLMTRSDIIHSAPFKAKVQGEIENLRKYSQYPDLKLLLYARSGSAFMLPGLMSTIPNIGMNDQEAEALAQSTNDTWFAYDTYASFIRAFSVYVLGIDEKRFQAVFDVYSKDKVSGEKMKQVVEEYKAIVREERKTIPEQMIDQVIEAMEAVYASWDSPQARAYRDVHQISQRWGTVVILQKGVFGNITETKEGKISGAGAASLTTMPDGTPVVSGEFRYRGQGDQIMSHADQNTVSVNRQESPLQNGQTLEELNPELYKQVLAAALKVRDIFGYDPLLEFVIERGELWITQSNDDYRTDNFFEFFEAADSVKPLARGKGLSGGAVRGWVANSVPKAEELLSKYTKLKESSSDEVKNVDGVILILDRVNPEMIPQIPAGVHILARKLSVHAISLAQAAGLSVVAEVPESQMSFDESAGEWVVSGEHLSDGKIISIDGHRNAFVYHKSGHIYLGSLPLAPTLDPAMAEPAPSDSGEDVTLKKYMADIERARQEGLIVDKLEGHENDQYSHLKSLTGYNTRFLAPLAKELWGTLLKGAQGDVEVMELGAGAGVAVSEMSRMAEQFGTKVFIDTVSLAPLPPRLRWSADSGKILRQALWPEGVPQQNIKGLIAYLHDVPLEKILKLQNQGSFIFETLPEPYVRQQYLQDFAKWEGNGRKYRFIYDNFGSAYHASMDLERRQEIFEKVFNMLDDDGVFYYEVDEFDDVNNPENSYLLKNVRIPEGFVLLRSEEKGTVRRIITRKTSAIAKKFLKDPRTQEKIKGVVYKVKDLKTVREILSSASADSAMQEPASVDAYRADIEQARQEGLIVDNLQGTKKDRFSHFQRLTGYNTRFLSSMGKELWENVLKESGHDVAALEFGAGAGVAVSEMSATAEEVGKKAWIDTIGLTPVAPHFRWKQGFGDNLEEILSGQQPAWPLPREGLLILGRVLSLTRIMELQRQGHQAFEILSEPYLRTQYLEDFIKWQGNGRKYQFIYDNRGALFYLFGRFFNREKLYAKILNLLDDNGVFYAFGIFDRIGSLNLMREQVAFLKDKKIFEGFVFFNCTERPEGGFITRKTSTIAKKLLSDSRVTEKETGIWYTVPNLKVMKEILGPLPLDSAMAQADLTDYIAKAESLGSTRKPQAYEAHSMFDPESVLDFTPQQMSVVEKADGRPERLKFGAGNLYHGTKDLNQILSDGFVAKGFLLTRTPAQYGVLGFNDEHEAPAVVMVDASTFNDLRQKNEASLTLVGDTAPDPYPKIEIDFPLDRIKEIWVSQDTYEFYKDIISGRISPEQDGQFKANLIKVFAKIHELPFRHKHLKRSLAFGAVWGAVTRYVLERNLLKDMPVFELTEDVAEKSPSVRDDALATKGGIDLTRDKVKIDIQTTGKALEFQFDPVMIQKIQNSSGLTPVIIGIEPMTTTLPEFLGLNNKLPAEQFAMRS